MPVARLIDPGHGRRDGRDRRSPTCSTGTGISIATAISSSDKTWKRRRQYLASDRTVGILGLGELGGTIAAKLRAMDFNVAGWSRRPKQLEGVHCSTDLDEVLATQRRRGLPVAADATNPGNPEFKNSSPLIRKDGCLINVARGGHVVIADLLAALDSGHLAHAYLDVFEHEPLPADSPLWTHPGITLTPHIAALTEPRTSVGKIAENIERVRRGEIARSTRWISPPATEPRASE